MVNASRDGFMTLLSMQRELTFMQASDYAEHAVNYFKFAMLNHADWDSVEIEIGGIGGTIELIEIKRDR